MIDAATIIHSYRPGVSPLSRYPPLYDVALTHPRAGPSRETVAHQYSNLIPTAGSADLLRSSGTHCMHSWQVDVLSQSCRSLSSPTSRFHRQAIVIIHALIWPFSIGPRHQHHQPNFRENLPCRTGAQHVQHAAVCRENTSSMSVLV